MSNDLLQQLRFGVEQVRSKLGEGLGSAQEFIRIHPVTAGVTIGGGLLAGAGLIATQIIKGERKKSVGATGKRAQAVSKKKRVGKRSRHSWRMDQLKISKEKHEVAYQKRKKRLAKSGSKKRIGKIYFTKKGQPYKIKADGRALFIKKTKRRSR